MLDELQRRNCSQRTSTIYAIHTDTRLNKSTAYRFLAHLAREGYLVRDLTGAYQAAIGRLGKPVLETHRRQTGETVNLAVVLNIDHPNYCPCGAMCHTVRYGVNPLAPHEPDIQFTCLPYNRWRGPG